MQYIITGKQSNKLTYCVEKKRALKAQAVRARENPLYKVIYKKRHGLTDESFESQSSLSLRPDTPSRN